MIAPPPLSKAVGARLIERHDTLARISEAGPGVTRLFATAEHVQAIERLRGWMDAAGLTTHVDAAGNLIGRRPADPSAGQHANVLLLGSHHDTVREGGRYDGAMGVLVALACAEALSEAQTKLPFHLDVVCFSDEEGTRYGTSMIGSRALAGVLDMAILDWPDADGIRMREAMAKAGFTPDRLGSCRYDPTKVLGYVEAHIEQGPILEAEGLPVGLVTGIAFGTRHRFVVDGSAGHAGTVPMERRRDALAGAAEMILAVERVALERDGVVATTGELTVTPGATNVIPGRVAFTLDLRAPNEPRHSAALAAVGAAVNDVAARRALRVESSQFYDGRGCAMDPSLRAALGRAVAAEGLAVRELFSGAGHDALSMRHLGPVGMVFVRCRGGVSHNPEEYAAPDDILTATRVLLRFLAGFAPPTAG